MKRRAFFSSAASAGFSGLFAYGCASKQKIAVPEPMRFDIHPFVREHPKAVFVYFTGVSSRSDSFAMNRAGEALARDLIVRTFGTGFSTSSPVTIKPDWNCVDPGNVSSSPTRVGSVTDAGFVEGWVKGMRVAGPTGFFIRESACPSMWDALGCTALCRRANIDLLDLSKRNVWELKEGREVVFRKVRDGVVLREVACMAPAAADGSFLVNIAKLKSRVTGVSGAVSNLHGLCARRFNEVLTPHDEIRKWYEPRYLAWFHSDFEKRIEDLYAKHVKAGIPRWNRPGPGGGILMEMWAQRSIDTAAAIFADLHMVEGIYSQDGDGYGNGPHEPSGDTGITSREYLSNIVIFGRDPFRVDIVAHFAAGHEPGNFGLFHLARERGILDVLDPRDIPLFTWKEGRAAPFVLDRIHRMPLVSPYLRRDYGGSSEPEYHIADEPFDYAAWKNPLPNSVRSGS